MIAQSSRFKLSLTRQCWIHKWCDLGAPRTYVSPAFGEFWEITVTRLSSSWFDMTAYLNGSSPISTLCLCRVLLLIPKQDAILCHVMQMDTQWEICSLVMVYLGRPGWPVKVIGGNSIFASADLRLPSCSWNKLQNACAVIPVGDWHLYSKDHIGSQQHEKQIFLYCHQAFYKAFPGQNN